LEFATEIKFLNMKDEISMRSQDSCAGAVQYMLRQWAGHIAATVGAIQTNFLLFAKNCFN
jgi:hypothetical protein